MNRNKGIGGSDIGAILGVNPYRSELAVYLEKIGAIPPSPESEQAHWGKILEPIIAKEYEQREHIRVIRCNRTLYHPDFRYMYAHIDRAIWDDPKTLFMGGRFSAPGILECKTANQYLSNEWVADEIPPSYIAQTLWYIGIVGADYCDVAALIGGQRYIQKRIERDEETISWMFGKARDFWESHVLTHSPPEPRDSQDALLLHPVDNGLTLDADEATFQLCQQFSMLKSQNALVQKRLDELESKIKIVMGEAAILNYHGLPLATWKTDKKGQRRFLLRL